MSLNSGKGLFNAGSSTRDPAWTLIILSGVLFLLLTKIAIAQPLINIKDIKKINLVDASGGLSASHVATFEIIPENNGWKCYQTKQSYEGMYFTKIRKDSAVFKSLNSDKKKFVKDISDTLIAGLLNTIKTRKPVFKPAYIYVSKDSVMNNIKYPALKEIHTKFAVAKRDSFLKILSTGQLLDETKISLQGDWWTDDGVYCAIHVISKNNDTLKIETRRQVDYMLPWLVNGSPDYDTAISRFYMAAIGNYPFSSSQRMSGTNIYWRAYEYIRRTYTDEIFARDDMEKASETNLKLLKKNFQIGKVEHYGSDFLLRLYPKLFSKKILIKGIVDIKNSAQVNQLIKFSDDTLKSFFNSGNFLTTVCKSTKGCIIYFSNDHGVANKNHWFASRRDKTNVLSAYDNNKLLNFSIGVNKPDPTWNDEWLALPDGKLVLFAYFYDTVFGVPKGAFKTNDRKSRKDVFILFDKRGKLLNKPDDGY